MGGFIFIIPAVATALFLSYGTLSAAAVLTVLGYGIIGFLDDFIKVKTKTNRGLRAYQKLFGQLGIAVIVSWFAYKNQWVGDAVKIPFFDFELKLGIWYFFLSVFMFVAVTNAVNLTDGLDGLAAGTGFTAMVFLLIACVFYYLEALYYGMAGLSGQIYSLSIFVSAFAFSLLGFFAHNVKPAKIFMGDTGSLALGGAVCCAAVFMRNPLILSMICVVYAWSGLSVVLQVASFKLRKKRIFKMAPYHHHLEKSGVAENKITAYYIVTSVIAGIVGLISIFISIK
jgi:phospho-N-acetylmuramoyl-pentapeptide-transferase